MYDFHYLRPATIDEASRVLATEPDAKPMSGGMSLLPAMKQRLSRWSAIVDLCGVAGLDEIRMEHGALVIGARARQMKRRGGLNFVVVDHLGLVKASDRYAGSKVNETGETTGTLKALAKELDIPVFLLAQINRGVESRDDKRPTLADLRHSGDIEQDADTVMFLYREAYYLGLKEPRPGTPEFDIWTMDMERCWDQVEILVAKQRSGPTGTIKLVCDIAHNAIRDPHHDDGLPAISGDFA